MKNMKIKVQFHWNVFITIWAYYLLHLNGKYLFLDMMNVWVSWKFFRTVDIDMACIPCTLYAFITFIWCCISVWVRESTCFLCFSQPFLRKFGSCFFSLEKKYSFWDPYWKLSDAMVLDFPHRESSKISWLMNLEVLESLASFIHSREAMNLLRNKLTENFYVRALLSNEGQVTRK